VACCKALTDDNNSKQAKTMRMFHAGIMHHGYEGYDAVMVVRNGSVWGNEDP
jgi:hypothetical protein